MIKHKQLFPFKSLEKIQENLFYLFVIFLPTQLGKHFWLEESLKNGLRVDYFALKFYFLDFLVILIVLLLLFQSKKEIISFEKIIFPILIFIQIFWSKTPISHLYFSLRILFSFILIILAKKYLYYDQKKINTIFFYQSLFLFLSSTIQVFSEKNIGSLFYFLGERSFSIITPGISLFSLFGENHLRPYSTFSHPNALAGYSLILFFYTQFFNKNKEQSTLIKILLFLTITLTFSQNAWFFFIIFLLTNYIIKKNKQSTKRLILTMFLSILIPFIMLVIGKNLNLSQDFEIRNILFENGMKNNYKNILFGGGWFSDIVNLVKNNTIVKGRPIYQPIHNSWWFIVLSIGIMPLIALKKHFKTTHINKSWLIIFSLIIATGTFDHYWVSQIQNYYLLIFLFIDFPKKNL